MSTITTKGLCLRLIRSFSSEHKKIIGILRETKNRWESRVPLTPNHIKDLKAEWGNDLDFIIQPSRKRVFQDDEYIKVGASVDNDLSKCDLLMGVKEVPIDQLIPNKSYIFFSHTHKGQSRNIPLLKKICDSKITLYDYELMADKESGKRLVAFGKFAGYSGMINAFNGLGNVLLSRGIRSPFINVPLTHHFRNLKHVKDEMISLGHDIKTKGISKDVNPIVFTFTGNGNVSKGAQEIFSLLPHEWIDAKDLKNNMEGMKNDRVYGCLVEAKNYLKRKDQDAIDFDYKEYLSNPERFESTFHETIAPYSTVIVNGIYWEDKYPRLLTREQFKRMKLDQKGSKLLTIADISCDLEGSIEFMNKESTIDEPFYYYNVKDRYESEKEFLGNLDDVDSSVQIMSIDNLPTELPEDSSEFFGNQLKPLIGSLVGLESSNVSSVVEGSKITDKGEIVQIFSSLLTPKIQNSKQKTVLILGSGYVVPPVIDFFEKQAGNRIKIVIGTATPEEAKKQFIGGFIDVIGIDVLKDTKLLNNLINTSDIVISLLPAILHVKIAELCIKNRKNLVTASYISSEMESLNQLAVDSGVLLLNEIGLDPGLDHLAAMKVIDECRERGEEIESFVSWCGGLPAPESATSNPFGYKFSWSPRGVLLATQNSAQYLKNGQIQHISSENLLKSVQNVTDLHPVLKFEGIPNRDSLKYIKLYGLDKQLTPIKTMFRGTLRYKGFCDLIDGFKSLGFLDQTKRSFDSIVTWKEFTDSIVKDKMIENFRVKEAMEWLGLYSNEPIKNTFDCNLDVFCGLLQDKLVYTENERDMTFLYHSFTVFNPKTNQRRKISVNLCEYGEMKGFSAMARTVGVPVALAAWKILEKEINAVGVKGPLEKEIYEPILKDLPIKFKFDEINSC